MADLGNLFQKAVYLGVGLASYTTEKASGKLGELRAQAQKLADELVQRGEMTAEDAKRMVEEMMQQSQQAAAEAAAAAQNAAQNATQQSAPTEPRKIDITDGDDPAPGSSGSTNSSTNSSSQPTDNTEPTQDDIDNLRQQVEALQEQLRRLKD